MRLWKLFWVTAPHAEENCFVVAVTARQAASIEEDSGFDRGTCEAEFILTIPKRLELFARRHHGKGGKEEVPWPNYAQS